MRTEWRTWTRVPGRPGGGVVFMLAVALAFGGCVTEPEADGPVLLPDADLRVIFVGNSLTAVEDIPSIVQALADADGRSMSHVSLVRGGFSLADHWEAGAQNLIRDLEADVVVLQEGSASTASGREHLLFWANRFGKVIRDSGGTPAMYMVWPRQSQADAFPYVRESYELAADTVQGLFVPAGQTWVEASALDDALPLYTSDGIHQTYLGALAAAQTLYAVLFDVPADSIPALDDGVGPAVLDVLRTALAASLASAGYGPAPLRAP